MAQFFSCYEADIMQITQQGVTIEVFIRISTHRCACFLLKMGLTLTISNIQLLWTLCNIHTTNNRESKHYISIECSSLSFWFNTKQTHSSSSLNIVLFSSRLTQFWLECWSLLTVNPHAVAKYLCLFLQILTALKLV